MSNARTGPRRIPPDSPCRLATAGDAETLRCDDRRPTGGTGDEIVSTQGQNLGQNFKIWRLGPMLLLHARTLATGPLRGPCPPVSDGSDHVLVRVMMRGRAISLCARWTPERCTGNRAGECLGRGFADDGRRRSEWATLWIPPESCPELVPRLDRLAPGLVPSPCARLLAEHIAALVRYLPHTAEERRHRLAKATRALVSACLHTGTDAPAPDDARVLQRERITRIILDNLGSARLTPGRICEIVGISRSTLYRLFEERGGVAAYVQQLRLAKVHADLLDPALAGEPIGRVAERRGFHSTPAFNRSFRRRFGCTPGDVRAAALAGKPPPCGGLPEVPLATAPERIENLAGMASLPAA